MVTRLEKAASDNGFDLYLAPDGDWLSFGSSHTPLRIWLTAHGEALLLVAVSQPNVWRSLVEQGAPFTNPLPVGASGARGVNDFTSLHHLLRRAMQLSRSLPDAPRRVFESRVAGLPRATEAERLVVQRVGQDVFRQALPDAIGQAYDQDMPGRARERDQGPHDTREPVPADEQRLPHPQPVRKPPGDQLQQAGPREGSPRGRRPRRTPWRCHLREPG